MLNQNSTHNVKKILNPEKTFEGLSRDDFKVGDRIEVSPESMLLMSQMSDMVNLTQGMGLVIDYGENQAMSDSL